MGEDGVFGTGDDSVSAVDVKSYGVVDPEGVAYNNDTLYIAGGSRKKITIVTPGQNGVFDGASPQGDDQASSFSTRSFNQNDPEGVEYNSDNNTLLIVSHSNSSKVAEVTLSGELVREIDISFLNAVAPSGITYGPSSFDNSKRSIYIVDRGVDNDVDPNENDGVLYEVQLDEDVTPTPTPIPDAEPPFVAVTSPEDGAVLMRGSTVTIEADASDNAGVDRVEFSVSGKGGASCTDSSFPYTCDWSLPGRPNASYTVSAEAFDLAGNSSVSSVQIISSGNKKAASLDDLLVAGRHQVEQPKPSIDQDLACKLGCDPTATP